MGHFVNGINWYFTQGTIKKVLKVPAELCNSNSVYPIDDSNSKIIIKKVKEGKKNTASLKKKKKYKKQKSQ